MTVRDYLNLITSAWQQKPKYTAMITADVSVQVQVQKLLASMIPLFDLFTHPVGDQLDIIGKWVGVSRNIPVPIEGVYFSWETTSDQGWDFGSWQPSTLPVNITSLPDDAYLSLIRAKIAANQWDGTTDGAYAIWDSIFPQYTILIQDNMNMSFALALIGGIVDSLTLALLTQGLLPLRPEGVEITEYFVAVDTNPAFGWDIENVNLAGWDEGSWLREIVPT